MGAGKCVCTSCGAVVDRVYAAPGLADGVELCLRCLEEWAATAEPVDVDSMEDAEGPYFWNR